MFLRRFFLFLILPGLSLISGLPLVRVAVAANGSASDSCAIIHRYESYCRYLSPDSCLQYISGFDYSNNAEHQAAWDDFYHLCGEDPRRDPRGCIAYLGIADTCAPSVEAPPLVERYMPNQTLELAPFQRPTVEIYREPARICGLWERDYRVIDEYRGVCGEAKPAECSAASADYTRLCGDKNPCECVESMGCGRSYCETPNPVSPPTGVGNSGTETPSGGNPVTPPVSPTSPGAVEGAEEGVGGVGDDEIPNAPQTAVPPRAPISSEGGVEADHSGGRTVVSGGVFMSGSGCSLQASTSASDGFSWAFAIVAVGSLAWLHARRTRQS